MRVQGGTSGLIAAIVSGRVDPLSGEEIDLGRRRGPSARKDWYMAARREREVRERITKEFRRKLGREVLRIGDLPDLPPF